jgi:hypothetical protein
VRNWRWLKLSLNNFLIDSAENRPIADVAYLDRRSVTILHKRRFFAAFAHQLHNPQLGQTGVGDPARRSSYF